MTLWDWPQVVKIVRAAHARAAQRNLPEVETLRARAEALSAPIEDMKRQVLLLMTAAHCEIYPSTIDLVTEVLVRAEYAQKRYLEEVEKIAQSRETKQEVER